jgi:16S rRNA C967 or C1407 C5-methylase (RsmB/RsmF family)
MHDFANMASHYRQQYGDRTYDLFQALARPIKKVALLNPFVAKEKMREISAQGQRESILGHDFYWLPRDLEPVSIDGLMSHYFLDRSSVLAPLCLPLSPNTRVLDMCSAPGGKMLVMASRGLKGVELFANDLSPVRFDRMRRVFRQFIPDDIYQAHVRTSCRDAIHFGLKEGGRYDAIMLDAPCSSEGHVIKNERLLQGFKGLRKNLPMRQYALLSAALLALRPGGYVVYSTCSINHRENQEVIRRILTKKKDVCSIQELALPMGRDTGYGIAIEPDLHGAGPAFICLLKKR